MILKVRMSILQTLTSPSAQNAATYVFPAKLLHAMVAKYACANTGGYDHTVKLWDVRAKQACHTHGTLPNPSLSHKCIVKCFAAEVGIVGALMHSLKHLMR